MTSIKEQIKLYRELALNIEQVKYEYENLSEAEKQNNSENYKKSLEQLTSQLTSTKNEIIKNSKEATATIQTSADNIIHTFSSGQEGYLKKYNDIYDSMEKATNKADQFFNKLKIIGE